ncbi:PAS domain S-box-containing protein [Bradyrhizobium sp. OAE829]
MARPSRTGGKKSEAKARNASPAKGRKTTKTKPRTAPAAARVKRRSVSDPIKDLKEAREQQAATAEILKVIASSPSDVQPVFEAIASSANRLLGGFSAAVFRFLDNTVHLAAFTPVSPAADAALQADFPRPVDAFEAFRLAQQGKPFPIPDTEEIPHAPIKEIARLHGFRSMLFVPLMSNGVPIGIVSITRATTGSFAEHHVQLMQTFADQAVIAIENVRLFNETQEALKHQIATSEVLQVIGRSMTDTQPVFERILDSTERLLDCRQVSIFLAPGDGLLHVAARRGTGYEAIDKVYPLPIEQTSAPRVLGERRQVYLPDVMNGADVPSSIRRVVQVFGNFSVVMTPMIWEGQGIGLISVLREPNAAFTPKELSLLRTFADQAVIAIENVRLFKEVQAKTADLSESLQQQTATADVLKVISRSAFDLQTVLETLVVSAARLCEADEGTIFQPRDHAYRLTASCGLSPPRKVFLESCSFQPGTGSTIGRVLLEGKTVHIEDSQTDQNYRFQDPEVRTRLGVPLLRDDAPIGVFVLARRDVRPFSDKQIELVQTFADQAVIAIENARLFNETQEALEQQKASSDILRVISSSVADAQPVFDKILDSCKHLFGSDETAVLLVDEEGICTLGAYVGKQHEVVAATFPAPVDKSPAGRAIREGRVVHYTNAANDVQLTRGVRHVAKVAGYEAMAYAPMMWNERGIGAIGVSRLKGSFSDKELALLQAFADQAVIAIQNARLFNETREALERQTATAEILKVINNSPGDLAPVFQVILEKATLICGAGFGVFTTYEGDDMHQVVATRGVPSAVTDLWRRPVRLGPETGMGRLVRGENFVHIIDASDDEGYRRGNPVRRALVDIAGARTYLAVPLRRDEIIIGAFTIYRREVRPFIDKQIALLQTFADQAVIAIENARLFDEVQAKTRDLSESLQQQTATADVLKVISRSSVDLERVLDTLVETVVRLCRADQALMYRQKDDRYHLVAVRGLSAEVKKFILANPFAADRGTVAGRAVLEHRAVHIPDALQDPEYHYEGAKLAGGRTLLGIPLLREDVLIGILVVVRTRADPFTSKEIELATSFSDQAVIAIENARLFEELRDRQAELRVTFDNMGDGVVMFDAAARLTAWNRNFQEMLDLPNAFLAGRPSYAEYFRYLADRGEYSTDLEAQLSRTIEDISHDIEMRFERTRPDGRVIEVRRNPVPSGGFVLIYSDITERKHAEEAIRTARDAAEAALRDLQTAQDRLIQTEKLASLGQLTAGIAHEIKNPLNFINNFSAVSAELTDELNDVLKPVTLDSKVRGEVDELTGLLKDNLEKVVQHGKRADSIVKNMLLHSREGSGEQRPADINALVDESLNLAYHGARAEKGEFNITLQRDFDADAGTIELFPQEITRAFLNLIANGVYAATERKLEGKEASFEPTLRATTKNLGTTVEIRIRDNGSGIPLEVQQKMFNPFFTTKPAGEGTGLGLSMTHDIIVKQHGGRIEVYTEPGAFTEFVVTLPRKKS